MQEEIVRRLQVLQPDYLQVIDETSEHAGHQGALDHAVRTGVAEGTHFKIRVISRTFTDKTRVAQHRVVYGLLHDLLATRIHALKIETASQV
ncbi:MAG: BolA family transcriptional regulator [Betaproteobacteria bacterium]|nr:BolA family transcriptional regulator [Betaproteobacteria bacterium]